MGIAVGTTRTCTWGKERCRVPFHARVKRLAAVKHLEHKSTVEELRDELAYIEQL